MLTSVLEVFFLLRWVPLPRRQRQRDQAFVLCFFAFGGGDGGTQAFTLSFFVFGGGDSGIQDPELALESLASSGTRLVLFSATGADLAARLGLLSGARGYLRAGVGLLSGARVGVLSVAGVGPL